MSLSGKPTFRAQSLASVVSVLPAATCRESGRRRLVTGTPGRMPYGEGRPTPMMRTQSTDHCSDTPDGKHAQRYRVACAYHRFTTSRAGLSQRLCEPSSRPHAVNRAAVRCENAGGRTARRDRFRAGGGKSRGTTDPFQVSRPGELEWCQRRPRASLASRTRIPLPPGSPMRTRSGEAVPVAGVPAHSGRPASIA
jgi:hypothetical protein